MRGLPLKRQPTQKNPQWGHTQGGPTQGGPHSRGPPLKGARTQCVEALLSGGPLVGIRLCTGPFICGGPPFCGGPVQLHLLYMPKSGPVEASMVYTSLQGILIFTLVIRVYLKPSCLYKKFYLGTLRITFDGHKCQTKILF
jgi:hypothetical protein